MALQSGLYKVHFLTQAGEGNGVVVMQGGRLRGGDSLMYYVGTYSQEGNNLSAKIATDRHSTMPGMHPVFGMDRVIITISGTTEGDSAKMAGSAAEAPGVTFSANLTRLGD